MSTVGVWGLLCNLSKCDNVDRTLFSLKSRALLLLVAVYYKFEMYVVVGHVPQKPFLEKMSHT